MSKLFFTLAFAIGLAVVAWIGAGFVGSDLLALAFTGLIGAVYCLGFGELVNFRRQTHELNAQVHQLPESQEQVNHWLGTLPAPMQFPVQRRIEGHAAALPGPQLTPYLTGLLVMLGLLGTFIGMIVTLQGAVSALEGGNNLAAVQSALAAPIAGLSLAFGTSIAGVAASAMLGLGATLSRRERTLVGRELDAVLRRDLRAFSLKHQQQEAFRALQSQSDTFPAVVDSLQALTRRLEQMGDQLNSALTDNQKQFHEQTAEHYRQLAASVGDSLSTSLADSSRLAAESVRPVIAEALERLNDQAAQSHQRLSTLTESQLSRIAERFDTTTEQAARHWREGLAEHQQTAQSLTDKVAAALQAQGAWPGAPGAHAATAALLAQQQQAILAAQQQAQQAQGQGSSSLDAWGSLPGVVPPGGGGGGGGAGGRKRQVSWSDLSASSLPDPSGMGQPMPDGMAPTASELGLAMGPGGGAMDAMEMDGSPSRGSRAASSSALMDVA